MRGGDFFREIWEPDGASGADAGVGPTIRWRIRGTFVFGGDFFGDWPVWDWGLARWHRELWPEEGVAATRTD